MGYMYCRNSAASVLGKEFKHIVALEGKTQTEAIQAWNYCVKNFGKANTEMSKGVKRWYAVKGIGAAAFFGFNFEDDVLAFKLKCF